MTAKQVIVIRKELNMRKGKMVAQGAHASEAAVFNRGWFVDRFNEPTDKYEDAVALFVPLDEHTKPWLASILQVPPQGFKKVVVSVDTETEIKEIYQKALDAKIPTSLIVDSGLTEFNGIPTITAVAVGPAAPEIIDPITGSLRLL